jgi:hypothetical protein
MFRFTGLNDLVAGDLKSIEGMDYAVICEAENLTKKSFDILNYTIRKETSEIWIQFNPRYADDFVCEFCINNPPENMIGARVNGFALTEDGRVVRADNPHVSDSQLVEAMRMLRTDRRAFDNQCLGIPLGQGGRILPMYDPDVHDIDFDLDRLSQCNLFMAIDPHRKYYPAILWFAITPSASVVVYNEYPKYSDLGMYYDEARDIVPFDLDLKELSNVILANDMNLKSKLPVVRTGDPRFLTEFPDMTRVLGEHGVVGWVDAPHELIETQREHLKALLNWNPALPFAGMNTPQFYVARGENTRNVRRALMRHCWSEDKDKESEKYKDFIDAIRYFLSILNGQVRYVSSAQGRTGIPLKSLSSVMLETMPASGYFQQKRPA